MKVRRLKHFDKRLEDIADLDEECFPEDDRMTFAEMVLSVWWVVLEEGCIIAYLGARAVDDNKLDIHRVGVAKEHRGKKLHQRLLRSTLRWGKGRGYERASTYVSVDNLPSLNSFIALGFRFVESEDPAFLVLERPL